MRSQDYMDLEYNYGAHNYKPIPVVIDRAERVWVWDVEGKRYLDMLSSYSALNHGHRHPKIIEALERQLQKVTLTSRAFYNSVLGLFEEKLAKFAGYEKVLPMNTGAEAVESALKIARKWAYYKRNIPMNEGNIIALEGNFHGRTITIISFSTEHQYKDGFGPYTPGFKIAPFGDARALENLIDDRTLAILVEPIQGEGGVRVPPQGYLAELRRIATKHRILLMFDEIQTGLGRTGKMFAWQWEDAKPDVLILGKALGGGIYPVSAVLANNDVMDVLTPGDHGSTFGGNPLAAAVGMAAIDVLVEEKLDERARTLGEYFMNQLKHIKSDYVKEIRGKGLLIGIEIKKEFGTARPFCEKLAQMGILCKETHEQVIRFAPPLVIEKEEIDWALERIERVLTEPVHVQAKIARSI
ncbi:ornithine-oxoacid aminotransferase [Pseudothermotoga hypogea DSM 11164 = NBRC 106472]|uniref:ornithine aminotransferase n=1 Tax=Pseudothermotoga hypogea DSM 11164 = NBRC 106472 TaxID=1123384 RepID=A0A0X1KPG0_9THEM|nr:MULTISPECIES: ornithine--oxo-acid transaminase [Pseudothermotoga]AJC73198.1 ornithine-oxoacid aminotransferase [Pseudothermotoga hypogea DSM 11164 = NBRC 106472]MBC7123318.1 ornithine--oxo-acid transaminase [Pseudothermotoga sp.]MDI6863530.1 ornithine--oxo-acid transaminase [Pseudothermotoga sp.]